MFHMKRILYLSIFFSFFIVSDLNALAKYFKITSGIKNAYTNITNLKLEKAQSILDSIKKSEPNNMLVYHIENYIDFYRIFINENYNEYQILRGNKEIRLKKLSEGDKNSPFYRFSLAEVNLQWALERMKFEEYFTAIQEIRNANDLLIENAKLFPDFTLNKKSLSAIHAIIGTLPDSYKYLLRIVSNLNGSIKTGVNEINETMTYCEKYNSIFKEESYTIGAFIALYLENNNTKAWNLINKIKISPMASPLACFVKANIAFKTGRNDEAITLLENRINTKDRLPFYYLDYMLGKNKLYRLDKDADNYLADFINNFKGVNYIKDAYLKLAWYELVVNDDTVRYKKYIEATKKYGSLIVDEDKSALKEAQNNSIPNVILLTARILFDGSYYLKAYKYLDLNKSKFKNGTKNILEFNYRMGRILQNLQNYTEALSKYKITIKAGKSSDSFFACSAALQSGIIYENLGDKKNAINNYRLCLNINPEEYKNSLHQKAKAGLLRLK